MIRPFAVSLSLAALAVLCFARPAGAFTPAEARMPMTVTLVRGDAPGCGADCPEWLALTGLIGPGTPGLLSAALARLGRRDIPVLVDSPGGSVEAAMAMGRAIRTRKLAVVVAGTGLDDCAPADRACAARRRAGERPGFVAGGIAACASACVLILAAGAERSVGENSYVGVHQMTAHRTLTRVMNYFRVVRRLVNGRPVEVSRTLVDTRPISSRTLVGAASEAAYSEVDRYLLGLGIAESIMPLMRSAPPGGMHWMTASEVAATRIATDTTDARTFLDRAAARGSAKPTGPGAAAAASAMLGDGARMTGTVAWRVEREAAGPALVGAVEMPDRGLRGTFTLRRNTAPGDGGGFSASADFGSLPTAEAGQIWTVKAPLLCEAGTCDAPFAPAGPSAGDPPSTSRFRVIAAWGDALLSGLRDRERVTFPLSADDGKKGWISLPLGDDVRAVVAEWERRCCGLAPTPSVPPPAARVVAAVTPVPAAPEARPAPTTVTEPAPFSRLRLRAGSAPEEGRARVEWTLLAPLDRPGTPGSVAMLGTLVVPDAGLRLGLEAGPAADGAALSLSLSLVGTTALFGPALALSIPPVWGQDGHVAVMAERVGPLAHGGGFVAALSEVADPPPGAELVLELTDRTGRLDIRLPLDGPLGTLLRLARRPPGPAAG